MRSSILPTRDAAAPAQGGHPTVYPRVRASVIAVFLMFAVFYLYRLTEEPVANVVGAFVITAVALVPALLWASGHARGLPILPAHAATIVLAFAVPLVSGHPEIAKTDGDAIFLASFTVVLYTVVAGGCWYAMLRGGIRGGATYAILPMARGYGVLLGAVLLSAIYYILVSAGWILLEPNLSSIVRAIVIAITSIALFVIGVRFGGRGLTPGRMAFAIAVILLFIVTQLASLYLGGATISAVSLVVGYAIGSQRIPWLGIISAALILAVLHAGKAEMRERYWWGYDAQSIAVGALPQFILEWVETGSRKIALPEEESQVQPIYERLSLMHLLLLAQRAADQGGEFIGGETYTLIPRILLPRFLDPDKPSPHDATNLLSEWYGLQTAAEQEGTQIGWGIVTEGYANFGIVGVVGVAVVMGLFLGWVTRLSVMAPLMSLQNFLGILVMAMSVQTEFTMATLLTATLQAAASMLLLWPLCEFQRAPAHG